MDGFAVNQAHGINLYVKAPDDIGRLQATDARRSCVCCEMELRTEIANRKEPR